MRVQKVYNSLEELESYDSIYNIAKRCGYNSCEAMWKENKIIQGGINLNDLSVVNEMDFKLEIVFSDNSMIAFSKIFYTNNVSYGWSAAEQWRKKVEKIQEKKYKMESKSWNLLLVK